MAGKGVSSAAHLLQALIFLSWSTLSSAPYTLKTVFLNDNVALLCNKFCQGPRTWTDLDGNEVAYCEVDGRCRYGNGFENIKMSNESKNGKRSLDLFISPVHFSDQGLYLGTCDEHHCDKKLQVLAPQTVTAYTGGNVTLPFYAVTDKNGKDFFFWEKNGKMGVKLNGTWFTHGVIPMDRGQISKDGYKRGDLSLHLSFLRPSDAGLYLVCHSSPMGDTDKCQAALYSVMLKVPVPTFQVQDDAPVTVPVISDGPVAVTSKGHDGGPEVEVCTLSEGQQQCTPQHGGMFAMQDAKLTFTRGSSTRGEVYVLKDVNKGYVIYRFNVTRAAKEASWICWGTALSIIALLGPAQVISCIRHQDLATLISSLYTWLIGQVRRRRSNSEEVTHSPVPQSEEDEVTHSEVQQSEEEDVKISVEVVDEFELKTESSTRRIEE